MTNQPAFKALADPTRREILMALSEAEMNLGQIAERFPMTRAAVKKHLKVLEDGGLIASRKEGRQTMSRLTPDGLRPVVDWLGYFDRLWDTHLSRLQQNFTEKD